MKKEERNAKLIFPVTRDELIGLISTIVPNNSLTIKVISMDQSTGENDFFSVSLDKVVNLQELASGLNDVKRKFLDSLKSENSEPGQNNTSGMSDFQGANAQSKETIGKLKKKLEAATELMGKASELQNG